MQKNNANIQIYHDDNAIFIYLDIKYLVVYSTNYYYSNESLMGITKCDAKLHAKNIYNTYMVTMKFLLICA